MTDPFIITPYVCASSQDPVIHQLRKVIACEETLREAVLSLEPTAITAALALCPRTSGKAFGLWLIRLTPDQLFALQIRYAVLRAAPETLASTLTKLIKSKRGDPDPAKGIPSKTLHQLTEKKGLPPLVYSKTPIQKPLTSLGPVYSVIAVRMFALDMLTLSAPVSANVAADHSREIFRLGTKIECLRDEIFCQLVMQLNGNPSVPASRLLWECLEMCVASMVPSPAIQEILEAFLLQEGRIDILQDFYLRLLEPLPVWRAELLERPESDDLVTALFSENGKAEDYPLMQKERPKPAETPEEDLARRLGTKSVDKECLLEALNEAVLRSDHSQAAYFMIKGATVFLPDESQGLYSEGEISTFWTEVIEKRYEEAKSFGAMKVGALIDLLDFGSFEMGMIKHYDAEEVSILPVLEETGAVHLLKQSAN